MRFDPNRMTVRDLNDFYDITGVEWEDLDDGKGNIEMPKGKSPKVLLAIAFIAGRKNNKDFTLDDAYDTEIVDLVTVEEVPAPLEETPSSNSESDTDESSSNSESPTSSA